MSVSKVDRSRDRRNHLWSTSLPRIALRDCKNPHRLLELKSCRLPFRKQRSGRRDVRRAVNLLPNIGSKYSCRLRTPTVSQSRTRGLLQRDRNPLFRRHWFRFVEPTANPARLESDQQERQLYRFDCRPAPMAKRKTMRESQRESGLKTLASCALTNGLNGCIDKQCSTVMR